MSAAEKFGLISKNRSFIKEKGFHHLDDFFYKTIANKGWRTLFQSPRLAATMVVRELYANLATHVLKKVWVRRVFVDFSANSINEYYNLEPVNSKAYDRLHETPNYLKVLRMLTNGQGQWKLNNEGHPVHFKAKHLAYIPKVWHLSCPQPPPRRKKGVREHTGTLYFLFQILVGPSLLTESKYHIKIYKIKLPP